MNFKKDATVNWKMTSRSFLASFFIVLGCTLLSTTIRAQHLVLFETFTNSCQPSSSSDDAARTAFNTNVSSVVSSEGSKIVHFDLHLGNLCDALQNPSAAQAAVHVLPPGNAVFWSAVDRTVFSSTGTRGSATPTDWTTAINQEASKSPAATLQLIDATLDKSNANVYRLHADVKVSLTSSIPDSLIIRFALVQDSCVDNQNGGTNNVVLNDVVRFITNQDTGSFVVFTGGEPAGFQKTMTWNAQVHGPSNFNDAVHWIYHNMRLVAFLETTNGSNFSVVNAAVLRQDLDSLQAPAPTLAITSSALDGMTFHPGDIVPIQYSSSNLTNGVNAYYSLDNGATWRFISTSFSSPINWQVPDSLTTQGKIQLVANGISSLTSTEVGNFTIATPATMTFLYPVNQVLHADSTYTIRWTKSGVDRVTLKYALRNSSSGYDALVTIVDSTRDTLASWKAPDTTDAVLFQLIDNSGEAAAASAFDTIERLVPEGVVSTAIPATGLTVMDIYPNPAASGEDMIVRYSDDLIRPVSIQVLDLLGHMVGEFSGSRDQEIHLDTRALASGPYIVRVSDGMSVVSRRIEILR